MTHSDVDNNRIPRQAYLLFFVFAALFGAGQFNRVSASVMTPVIEQELALTGDMLGFIAGVYFFASAAFQIPLGVFLDRYGPPKVIPFLMVLAVAGTVVYAMGDTAGWLILGRIMVGIGFGGASVIAFVAYAHWLPASKYASFSAWTIAFGNFGGIMATAPLAFAIAHFGRQDSFLGIAVISLIMGLAALAFVREGPNAPPRGKQNGISFAESLRGLAHVVRHPQSKYLMAIMAVTYGPGMALLGLWGAPYMSDIFAMDVIGQGNVLLAMAVTAPVGLIVAGFVERRIGSKKRIVLLFGAGVAAMFFLLAGFGLHSFWVSMLCFMGVMFFQGYYVMVQTQVRDIFPLHMVGRANTVINTFGVIGVFVMQWATGFIVRLFPGADAIASETAYRLIFAFIGISVFIGLWCYRNVADTVVNPTQP